MSENIDILIVEPGKAPYLAIMENTLEAAERILGGAAQVGCFLPQRVLLISRGRMEGLLPNRFFPHSNEFVSGTFLLCGAPEKGGKFNSLTLAQQKEFQNIFARPEEFMQINSTVYTAPADAAKEVHDKEGRDSA